MINRLQETTQQATIQDTTFATDVLGRYICNTWDEATNNGGVPFGAVAVPNNNSDPGTRALVWGVPWRSHVPFPGLAYCIGGRSLYWGGWSPRLTAVDLAKWPPPIAAFLQTPPGTPDEYEATERETGVFDKTDYISGPLNDDLKAKCTSALPTVPNLDAIEDAPLAVQAAPPASGLFSFDKYSSAPILIDAIRQDTANPDWRRRLFLVPRAHVSKLTVANGAVTQLEVWVNGQQRFMTIQSTCAVVLASGTIE